MMFGMLTGNLIFLCFMCTKIMNKIADQCLLWMNMYYNKMHITSTLKDIRTLTQQKHVLN